MKWFCRESHVHDFFFALRAVHGGMQVWDLKETKPASTLHVRRDSRSCIAYVYHVADDRGG